MRKHQAGYTGTEVIITFALIALLASAVAGLLSVTRRYKEQTERTTALAGWLTANNPEMNFSAKVGDTCGCDHGKTVPYQLELMDKVSDKFAPGLIFVVEQPKERPLQKGQLVTLHLVDGKIEVESP